MKLTLLAATGAALLGSMAMAQPANAAVNVSLAFGYPQPVVQEVYQAHPTCRAHPGYRSCHNYYHQAYSHHYHGRQDPHWHGHR